MVLNCKSNFQSRKVNAYFFIQPNNFFSVTDNNILVVRKRVHKNMSEIINENSNDYPWDENLPQNKEYIKKFYKKSEENIKQQEGEGNISMKKYKKSK